eukprot:TRINITY_DN9716_c0_g1_i1.p1 TRINITY_DN9716_c0_g1~~TRINITY_DN9716_c0_g1_i1.p1  ORF type:complete len:145 (+),score=8.72 TRINITY_DN9716_c0_g1_i1:47-481(+)
MCNIPSNDLRKRSNSFAGSSHTSLIETDQNRNSTLARENQPYRQSSFSASMSSINRHKTEDFPTSSSPSLTSHNFSPSASSSTPSPSYNPQKPHTSFDSNSTLSPTSVASSFLAAFKNQIFPFLFHSSFHINFRIYELHFTFER